MIANSNTGTEGIAVPRASQRVVYSVFIGFGILLLSTGFLLAPSVKEALSGYAALLAHPIMLGFDALYWPGNYGTAFVNAAIMLFVGLGLYGATRTVMQGVHVAALMLVIGFAFYGKNIVNICFPIAGVFLYAKRNHKPIHSVTALALFATSLSPVYSVTVYGTGELASGSFIAIALGVVFGVMAGYIVGVLAAFLPTLHKGRLLFNAGFAAGIAGFLINAIKSGLSIGHEQYLYGAEQYVEGENLYLSALLLILFLYFIILGIIFGGWKAFRNLVWRRCVGGNFIEEFGFGATLLNMGVVGVVSCLYVLLTVNGHLNGPLYAGIFTAAGFAAAGVTLRGFLPVMTGVYGTAFLTGGVGTWFTGGHFLSAAIANVSSQGMLLAAIFGCGFAPIVGTYGSLAGIFVGAMHCLIVPLTGTLHGWMSLYNNAFSMGIITIFLFPIYKKLKIGKREREIHMGPEE